VHDEGLSPEAIAKQLSMPKSTLATWVRTSKQGKLGEIGKTQRPLTEMELELAKVKRELAEVKMERDLLKKAAAYFAKEVK
jgi:transposase